MNATKQVRYIHPEFYCEVYGPDGPTGEICFALGATLVDAGGNVLGQYEDAEAALAARGTFRIPTEFRAVDPYRVPGQIPYPAASASELSDGRPSVYCGYVDSDAVGTGS